jgi:DNA-binding beta-propeller fold protein YncE
MLAVSCGGNPTSKVMPSSSCVVPIKPAFAYVLNGLSADTLPTGFFPQGIGIDPSGKFAYAANQDDDTGSMFTISAGSGTLTLVGTAATGSEPFRIAIDSSGHFAYVTNANGASVSIYTLKRNGTLTPAGTAATPGAAIGGFERNQLGVGQSDTKPYGPSLKPNLAPHLTRWRKLLHLCCTSLC